MQHYFATAWIPAQGKQRTNELLQVQQNLYAARTIEAVGTIAPGSSANVDAHLWVGPQDQKAMAAVAPGLELVVDYGWLTIIAKPLFTLMTWLHGLLGNWGWTIVALTVIIKAVFFPLAAASYRSMARMKQVAPRLQALKEKYGDDRQKLNQAMMEMYRTEKINPLGAACPWWCRFRCSSRCTGCCWPASRCAARRGSSGCTTFPCAIRSSSCRPS